MRPMSCCLALLLACLPSIAAAAGWTASVSDTTGLPTLSRHGGEVMGAHHAFWGANWKWADMDVRVSHDGALPFSLSGSSNLLGLGMRGRVEQTDARRFTWIYDLDARAEVKDVMGGGIVFRFDLANARDALGEPELLPGNRGWAWGKPGQTRFEMTFEPALERVYFELGNKGEIRALFYGSTIPRGPRRITATLNVTGDAVVGPSRAVSLGAGDRGAWVRDSLDWDVSPVDLSFLNRDDRPAGRRGFVRAKGDQLRFGDGTPARFWGTNLTAGALFETPKAAVPRQAKRLAALGFNLVRIHHHDSHWVVPNIFGRNARDTQTPSPEMLDRLDWWIKCLKDEGIYVWLDMHVQRGIRPGDGIHAFDEIARGGERADINGYNYVNPSIQAAMRQFNEAYISHVNGYTGIAYRDEPAILALLLTNENDLSTHYGNRLLPDKNVPWHHQRYMTEARAFAGGTGLPADKVWQSWKPGPAKLFLNDLEHRVGRDAITHLRQQGVKVPIATTSYWDREPLHALPALTTGDVIDVHSYGGAFEIERNPLYAPNLASWMAAGQVAGKPMSVSEWNVENFPAPDRHTIPLYIAATASHQGWDAMMHYAYAQMPLTGPGTPSNWHAFNDPALIATLPAAALLFRQGHVREAGTTYVFQPDKEQLFQQAVSPATSPALRTAAEKGKLLIALPRVEELPWLEPGVTPPGAVVLRDPKQALVAPDARAVRSDTGELLRDWDAGVFTVNTLQSQAAMGWLGGAAINLSDVDIRLTTRNASVAVQSLDGLPIRRSSDLLISLGARAEPTNGPGIPYLAEPVEGRIGIRAARGLKLYGRGAAGKLIELPFTWAEGRYRVELDGAIRSRWLLLRRPADAPAG